MPRASRRTPRTPPTPAKARGPAHAQASTCLVDVTGAQTIGDVCARVAAALDVPLRGEDDASALRRLAHALSCDRRSCVLRGVESLPDETREEAIAWSQRLSQRSSRASRLKRSMDLFTKRTKRTSAVENDELSWRDPRVDTIIRTLRVAAPPIPPVLASGTRLMPDSTGDLEVETSPANLSIDDALTELLAALPAIRRRGPLSVELDLLDQWLEIARTAHADPWLRAQSLMARGDALRLLGRLEEARIDLEEARSLARGEASLESAVIALLGRLHHHASRPEEAQMHYERALALAAESHDAALVAETLLDLATLLRDVGQARDALPQAERALALHASEGSPVRRARAAALVATLLHAEALHDEARQAYTVAMDAADRAGEEALVASSLANLGLLERQMGNRVAARASLKRGAERFARLGMAHSEARSQLAAALVILDIDAASAIEDVETAIALFAPNAAATDALCAYASAITLAFAHAEAGDRMAARALAASLAPAAAAFEASAPLASARGTLSALTELVEARLLICEGAARDQSGAADQGDALRRHAYQMYQSTKADLNARFDLPSEAADANNAARSLMRSLERALSMPVSPPTDRPSRTRRFF